MKYTYIFLLSIFLSCQTNQTSDPINLSELTITDIHKAYQEGEYNSRQLVQAYLERIEKLDAITNAITMINPDALIRARELDEEYLRTKVLRPLHGIPLIVKDNIHTKGMATTAGSLALANNIPEEDAYIIKQLKAAGAIIIAKSNMAEWAFTPWGSFSSTHGATLNAYNPDYSPGGSSGGTGAALAANLGVIGLGTDTGGSVRLPASHGSLVGIRPTMGLVSRSGIIPLLLKNDIAGPMCRTVEDAIRVLEVIAGYDDEDPLTNYSKGKIPETYIQFLQKDGLKGARIGVLRNFGRINTDPEIVHLLDKAILDMKAMGAELIDPVVIPDFAPLRADQWCDTFREDVEAYLAEYVKDEQLKTLEDIIQVSTKSKFTENELNYYATHSGRPGHPEIACLDVFSDQKRVPFREAIENYMDSLQLDALIYPTWNVKPYRMDRIIEEYNGFNTGIIAPHTGQPAISVPMGFLEGNLPTGIEFLGRMYAEPTLIKLAYAYEQGTKHRVPPE